MRFSSLQTSPHARGASQLIDAKYFILCYPSSDRDSTMKTPDVHVELLPNTDWRLTFHHAALDDAVVALAALPEAQRSGVARKLLAASAAYCLASTLVTCLRQHGVTPQGISADATVTMDAREGAGSTIQSLDLDVQVSVPPEASNAVDQCRTLLRDGSLIPKSLQQSITVNHTITLKRARTSVHPSLS